MDLKLNKNINPEEFIHLYWPREELSDFCLEHNIPDSVSRRELIERVYQFLCEDILENKLK